MTREHKDGQVQLPGRCCHVMRQWDQTNSLKPNPIKVQFLRWAARFRNLIQDSAGNIWGQKSEETWV